MFREFTPFLTMFQSYQTLPLPLFTLDVGYELVTVAIFPKIFFRAEAEDVQILFSLKEFWTKIWVSWEQFQTKNSNQKRLKKMKYFDRFGKIPGNEKQFLASWPNERPARKIPGT